MFINDENILRLCTTLWLQVRKFEDPADALLSKFFRENRKLKVAERNTIAETIYAILRNYRKLQKVVGDRHPTVFIAYTWAKIFNKPAEEFNKLRSVKYSEINAIAGLDRSQLELPDWVIEKISHYMSQEQIRLLDKSMSSLAPLTLRVNTLKANRNEVLNKLHEWNIDAEATMYSPYGIKLANKTALMNNQLFLDGCFEVQDEASQLAGLLLDAKRGEMVVDFCAGSGGKALIFGMMMRNSGRIYAFDTNERRLSNLTPRLKRSGLSNIYPQVIAHENDSKVKRLIGKIDKVFVDAPCLGLGTLRRNPDLKFRQSEAALCEITQKQLAILSKASKLVKAGGIVVYATCSILFEENRDIITQFLAENSNFEIIKISEILTDNKLALNDDNYLELYPHTHGTDGFFACVLKETSKN